MLFRSPPANPLVVPQTCMRFNDVDNVGITGRHNTGFIMIGQHAFVPEEEFDQPKYFDDIHAWMVEGMGIPLEDIVYHEDAWAGGGNFGCSLEFFSKGLEIGNQVYTMYERKGDDLKGLDIRVLDMGMGQERPAWFSHGTPTSYEPNFPTVMEKLFDIAGISPAGSESEIMREFLPYSGLLNMEEVDDIDATWKVIAGKLGVDVKVLRDSVLRHAALYSIADHTRTLLFALTDGGLPSNSGGGYNLRLIYRRAMDFINRYGWDLDLVDVCGWHSDYLVPQYPEMRESMVEVGKILANEKNKYTQTSKKAISTVKRLKRKQDKGKRISLGELIQLYDSKGISPDLLRDHGLEVDVPSDFYKKVSDMHEKKDQKASTRKDFHVDFGDLPETEVLYFDDYLKLSFTGKILSIVDDMVVLDRTAFYPTSGGQLHDVGTLISGTEAEVIDVFKQDQMIIHKVKGDISGWRIGDRVEGRIDEERRRQLAQHHTTTHIINGVCREVLGNHIWQAGAEKTEEKGRLDITHYETLDRDQLDAVEKRSNELISSDIEVESMILPRDEAEGRFGFRLYQGGAVPGERLRVVSIDELDTEACGGTHLRRTGEAIRIIITGTKKIQDGIVRLEYVAGSRAEDIFRQDMDDLKRSLKLTARESPDDLERVSAKIFENWKLLRKFGSKSKKSSGDPEKLKALIERTEKGLDRELIENLVRNYRSLGEPEDLSELEVEEKDPDIHRPHAYLHESAVRFKVQKGQIVRTLIRFLGDLEKWIHELEEIKKEVSFRER